VTETNAPPVSPAPYAIDRPGKEHRGYTPTFALATFGLFFAILTPILGGLSVKIQGLVGLEQAPVQLGIVTGIGSLFALISQPIAGRLSDATMSRFGMRRPWIIAGVVGTFLSFLVVGISPNIWVLLIGWCGAQLFSNFAQAAESATLADQVPEHRRGFVSGLAGAATPLAILAGAISLQALPNDLLRAVVPATVGLVFGLIFAFVLKDKVRTERRQERLSVLGALKTFWFNPKKHPDLGWAWLTKAMIMFGYGSVASYLTLFLATAYGMSIPEQLSFNLTATLVSVAFLVVVSIVGGKLSDKLARRRVFVSLGGILLGTGVILLGFSHSFGNDTGLMVILIAEAFIGIGAGLFFAVDQAMCIDVLPDAENTAKDLGVLNIANTLPAMVAPLLAGVIIIPIGQSLFGAGYTLWFVVAGLVAGVGGALVFRIRGVR
jgi:MFS family permease